MPAVIVVNGKEVRNPLLRFLIAAIALALAVIVLGGVAALVLGILGIAFTLTVGLMIFAAAVLVGLIPLVFLIALFKKR